MVREGLPEHSYLAPNVLVLRGGLPFKELRKWMARKFFKDMPRERWHHWLATVVTCHSQQLEVKREAGTLQWWNCGKHRGEYINIYIMNLF